MWNEKYRPQNLDDYFGNKSNVRILRNWIKSVLGPQKPIKKGVLLYGPPGTGKTSLINAITDEHNISTVEVNASDERRKEAIQRIIKTGLSTTLDGKPTFVVLDECENVKATYLHKILKNTNTIMIANDKYQLSTGVRKQVLDLLFDYPTMKEKLKYIDCILKEENERILGEMKMTIAKRSLSYRDVAKNLQVYVVSDVLPDKYAESDLGLFEEMKRLFNGTRHGRSKSRPDEVLLWALDNGGGPGTISQLDRFLGRCDDYRSWKYVYELIKYAKPNKQIKYPHYIKMLSKHKNYKKGGS